MTPNPVTYRGKTYKVKMYLYQLYDGSGAVVRIFDEGSSRSGKTFDTADFLYDICASSSVPLKIYCYRATLQDCKEKTLDDFRKKLQLRGVYDSDCMRGENILPEYRIKDSVIRFRGLDKMDVKEGHDCDIVYFNEMLDGVSRAQFDNITMRCTRMVIGDWNPKYTEHWAFHMEGAPDTIFTHTTYKDNPFCPAGVRRTIEGYEPTPENIAAGTADEWRWKVYGLGVRAAQEGLIFPDIDWIDEFPEDIERVVLGLDFGFTADPTACVRVGFRIPNHLYLQELIYQPIDDTSKLYAALSPHFSNGVSRCYADSADKYAKSPESMITAMRIQGLTVIPVRKYPGSVMDGITSMKGCKIHCVRSRNMQIEANSYVWETVNGIAINYPHDEFNHLWDAARYAVQSEFKNLIQIAA